MQQVKTKIAILGWHSGTKYRNGLKWFQIAWKISPWNKHPPFSNTYCFHFTCLDCDKENQQGSHLRFTLTLTLFQDKSVDVCPQAVASTVLDAAAGEYADY